MTRAAMLQTPARRAAARSLTRASILASLLASLLALALVAGGFLLFLQRAAAPEATMAEETAPGIAVLTGGPERVETGLSLLLARPDGRLLVSGVGPESELADLLRATDRLPALDPAAVEARTTLGRVATSTRGNAREVAAWARAGNLREITVVTAGFHMPRALLELRRALPEATFRPHPVSPFVARPLPMLREYLKLVGAGLGLSVLAERPRQPPP